MTWQSRGRCSWGYWSLWSRQKWWFQSAHLGLTSGWINLMWTQFTFTYLLTAPCRANAVKSSRYFFLQLCRASSLPRCEHAACFCWFLSCVACSGSSPLPVQSHSSFFILGSKVQFVRKKVFQGSFSWFPFGSLLATLYTGALVKSRSSVWLCTWCETERTWTKYRKHQNDVFYSGTTARLDSLDC